MTRTPVLEIVLRDLSESEGLPKRKSFGVQKQLDVVNAFQANLDKMSAARSLASLHSGRSKVYSDSEETKL
uniref:Uncharacterized protein n=1 Tax=Megaselia scalaris TaxID=36166 RepID=T1H3B0_MEGSC